MYSKFGLACYPKSWRGTVISPTKICIQFNNADLMTREMDGNLKMLPKNLANKPFIQITHHTDQEIGVLAVGCQMPEIEALQLELIESYIKYHKIHKDTYKEKYNKDFKDFVKRLKADVDRLDSIVDKD